MSRSQTTECKLDSTSDKKRVLFVCTHNEVRSLTAEQLYRRRSDLEVRSAGIASHAKNPLTPEVIDWADLVVTFEPKHSDQVCKRFPDKARQHSVVCLGLKDEYEYKSPKLVIKLVSKLKPYLGTPEPEPAAKQPSDTSFFRRWIQGMLFDQAT